MGFNFGGVTSTTRPADASQDKFDFMLKDHREPNSEWYLILLPGIPHRATGDVYVKSDIKVDRLAKDIEGAGIHSYVIASCISTFFAKEKIKAILDHVLNFRSAWPSIMAESKPKAIIALGAALYAINKSTDVIADHFLPVFAHHHEWSETYGVHVFPVHATDDILTGDGMEITWRRKWWREQLKNAQASNLWTPDRRPCKLTMLDTTETANAWMDAHMYPALLAVDTETDSLDFCEGHLGCVTMSVDGEEGVFVPWRCVDKEKLFLFLKSAERLVGHNQKFDVKFLWANGLYPQQWYYTDDSGQLSHAIIPGNPSGLKPLAFVYTNFGGYDDKLDEAKKQLKVANYLQIPESILSQYAILDAIATWRIFVELEALCHQIDETYPNEKQNELLEAALANDDKHRWGEDTNDMTPSFRIGQPWNIWRWYTDVMMPMENDCADLEYIGLYASYEKQRIGLAFLKEELDKEATALSKTWGVPKDFDFMSNKQLGELLTKMGWPVQKSDKNQFEIGDPVLQDFIREGRPGTEHLKRYRSISTQMGTFVGYTDENGDTKGWLQYYRYHASDDTYRIHTQFASMLAETFRHRSASPNFQNATSRGEFAHLIKQMVDVKHTFNYRVKFRGREFLLPHNLEVSTARGKVLARELIADDDIIDTDSLTSYQVKERTVKRVIPK